MIKSRYWIASAALAATIAPSSGARAQTDPDDPFTGPYIGVNAGLTQGSFSIGERTVTRPAETIPGDDDDDPDLVIPATSQVIPSENASTGIGPIVGAQLGFNVASRSMLFGIEGDFTYSTGSGSTSQILVEEIAAGNTNPARTLTSDVSAEAEFTGSARLRVGLRQQDLVYFVTGGLAAARIDTVSQGSSFVTGGVDGIRASLASDRATHIGYTGGIGVLGWFGGNAIGGVELRYTDYGTKTHDIAGSETTPLAQTEIGLTSLQLLFRMSYRF